MTCRKVREWFSHYLEGDLDPRARAEVEAHLEGCAPCRAERERFQRAVAILEEPPRPASSGLSLGEFRAALVARQAAGQRPPRPAWRWGLAAAAAASLAVGLGWWLWAGLSIRGHRPSEQALAWVGGPQDGEAFAEQRPSPRSSISSSPEGRTSQLVGGRAVGGPEQVRASGSATFSLDSPHHRTTVPRPSPRPRPAPRRLRHRTVRLAEGPKRAITVPAPTEKQRNSPTHQLTNSPTHQLTNSPPPPTAEADGAYYVEVHYPNGGYAILSGGSPEVLAELTAPLHSSYDVEITNTATGESHRLRLEYDTTVGGQRENVTIESERKIAEKDVSEKEERNDESKVS